MTERASKSNARPDSEESSSYPYASAPTQNRVPETWEGGPRPHNAACSKEPGGGSGATWTTLPPVRQLLALGWHRHLPAEAGMLFTSIAILNSAACAGKEMWHWLETWHSQANGYVPDVRQACAKEDVERRFNAEYQGPWGKSPAGLVALLADLGLVVPEKDAEGEENLRIPELLPLPEERLRLSEAEEAYLLMIRARHSEAPAGSYR